MTKDELRKSLSMGKTMDELVHYTSGQECLIFKAAEFSAGEEIIYIADIYFNEIPMDRPLKDDEEIEEVISHCFTGADFVDECAQNEELAERLFYYCDWQHPSAALPEVEDDEEDSDTP